MNKKYFLTFGAITTIAAPILAVISCGDNESESPNKSPSPTGNQAAFTVSINTPTITKGTDVGTSMKATITPTPGANQTATYKITTDSAGASVLAKNPTNTLSIDQTGKITGAYSGIETKLYVFVTIGSGSAKAEITVDQPAAPVIAVNGFDWDFSPKTFESGININPIDTSINIATVTPPNATNKTISYTLTDNDSGGNPELEKNGIKINEDTGIISGKYTSTTQNKIWVEATVGGFKKYIEINITRPDVATFDFSYPNSNNSIQKNQTLQDMLPQVKNIDPLTADTSQIKYEFSDSAGSNTQNTIDNLTINNDTGRITGSYTGSENSIWVKATIGTASKIIEISLPDVVINSFDVDLGTNTTIQSGSLVSGFNVGIINVDPVSAASAKKVFKFTTDNQGNGQTNDFGGLLIDHTSGQVSGQYDGTANSVFVQVTAGGKTSYAEISIQHPDIVGFNISLKNANYITQNREASPLQVVTDTPDPATAAFVPEYKFTDSASNNNPNAQKDGLNINPVTGAITGSYIGTESEVFVQVSVPRAIAQTPIIKYKSITVNPILITGFDFNLSSPSITREKDLQTPITITLVNPTPADADINKPTYNYAFVTANGSPSGKVNTLNGLIIDATSGQITGKYDGALPEIWIQAEAENWNSDKVQAYKNITVNPISMTDFDLNLTSPNITKGQTLQNAITITPESPTPPNADISQTTYKYAFVTASGSSSGKVNTLDGLIINENTGKITGKYDGALPEIWIQAEATIWDNSTVQAYKNITVDPAPLKTITVNTSSANASLGAALTSNTGNSYSIVLNSPALSKGEVLSQLKNLVSGETGDNPTFDATWDILNTYNKTINGTYKATISATGYGPITIDVKVTGNNPVPKINVSNGISGVNDSIRQGTTVLKYEFDFIKSSDTATKQQIGQALDGFVQKLDGDANAVTFSGSWMTQFNENVVGNYEYVVVSSDGSYKDVSFTVSVKT